MPTSVDAFKSWIKTPTGLETLTENIKSGLASNSSAARLTFDENFTIRPLSDGYVGGYRREELDDQALLQTARAVNTKTVEVFRQIESELASHPPLKRCQYLVETVCSFQTQLGSLVKRLDPILTQPIKTEMNTLSATTTNLERAVNQKIGELVQDTTLFTAFTDCLIPFQEGIEKLQRAKALIEYRQKQNSPITDEYRMGVAIVGDRNWVRVAQIDSFIFFRDWETAKYVCIHQEDGVDFMKALSISTPSADIVSATQAVQIAHASLKALQAFNKLRKDTTSQGEIQLIIPTKRAPSLKEYDYFRLTVLNGDSTALSEAVLNWLSQTVYSTDRQSLNHDTILAGRLNLGGTLDNLELSLGCWLETDNHLEDDIHFSARNHSKQLPYVQENLSQVTHRLSQLQPERSSHYQDALNLIIERLALLNRDKDREAKMPQALNIHAQVINFIYSMDDPKHAEIKSRHQKLVDLWPMIKDWGSLIRETPPSLIEVATLIFQINASLMEYLPPPLPVRKAGRGNYTLILGIKKKGVEAVFDWNDKALYCEKTRDEAPRQREYALFKEFKYAPEFQGEYRDAATKLTFSTFEFISGQNLREILQSPLTEQKRVEIAYTLVNFIRRTHELGYVIGNFGPESFVMNSEQNLFIVDAQSAFKPPLPFPSPHISIALAAPEIMQRSNLPTEKFWNRQLLTQQSDIWILGLMLYWILTNPSQFPPHQENFDNWYPQDKRKDVDARNEYCFTLESKTCMGYIAPVLPETNFFGREIPFNRFINQLIQATLAIYPENRETAEQLLGRIEAYTKTQFPEKA